MLAKFYTTTYTSMPQAPFTLSYPQRFLKASKKYEYTLSSACGKLDELHLKDKGNSRLGWRLFCRMLRLPASDTKMICISFRNWAKKIERGALDVPPHTRDLLLGYYRHEWTLRLPVLRSMGKAIQSTAGPSCMLRWIITSSGWTWVEYIYSESWRWAIIN
jgi:hypothetical protein